MAEKKLFGLVQESEPSDSSMNIAYGKATEPAKNITLGNLKTWITGSNPIKSITVEIGSWNMGDVVDSTKSISPQLSVGNPLFYNKIRGISSVIIRSDDLGSGTYQLFELLSDSSGTGGSSIPLIQVTKGGGVQDAIITLNTRTGSIYRTNQYYNDPSINRGWITILYVD